MMTRRLCLLQSFATTASFSLWSSAPSEVWEQCECQLCKLAWFAACFNQFPPWMIWRV
ncbi:hypothetical protein KC19_VG046600 [Ceratodon purpureus]|uniref:Secreted protein n=1 Tax=Ceratodon purpureus TaxID=3225 RepID=A0A8T0HLY3_CERPU|nr:hypothetical protein KC19_VG046600 [Ceratodon purpureus]